MRGFNVHNPATGDVIANVSNCGPDRCRRAVTGGYEAYQLWRNEPARGAMPCLGAGIHSLLLAAKTMLDLYR